MYTIKRLARYGDFKLPAQATKGFSLLVDDPNHARYLCERLNADNHNPRLIYAVFEEPQKTKV